MLQWVIKMNEIINIKDYLKENFDKETEIIEIKNKNIPIYLKQKYSMYQTMICDKECLLLVSKDNKILIKQLLKHIEQFNALGYEHIVFCFQSINTEQRKRLLDYKIAYIIPYIQIYLPFIYLNINEKYKKEITINTFSPSTQLVYIEIMLNQSENIEINEIIQKTKLSRMTINRAMRELIQLGVVYTNGKNTRKEYKRLEKEKYWSIGKKYLKSPVKKAIWINQEKIDEVYAGDSALEHLTMMNAVEYKVYAIDKRNIDKYISYEIPEQSQNCCKVEIWNYDPQLFADENNNVDIISLYSSFMNFDDERVHIELEELMEEYLNDRIREV